MFWVVNSTLLYELFKHGHTLPLSWDKGGVEGSASLYKGFPAHKPQSLILWAWVSTLLLNAATLSGYLRCMICTLLISTIEFLAVTKYIGLPVPQGGGQSSLLLKRVISKTSWLHGLYVLYQTTELFKPLGFVPEGAMVGMSLELSKREVHITCLV